jgi:phospholipid/cholesterol/gamma-HCH transport system substrate-binding protein
MENKAHAFAAGAFVLLLTALAIALAAWLTRDNTLRNVYEISSKESITGLQPQAAVRFRGIEVGKVQSIGFDPQARGHVLIKLSIDDKAPITESTFATLNFQGVTGLSYVQLDDGGTSTKAITAQADGAPRIPLRPGLLSSLPDQSARMLVQLEESSKRFNQLLAAENQKAIFSAVNELGQAAQGLRQLSGTLDASVKQQLNPALASLPALRQDVNRSMQTLQTDLTKTSRDFSEAAQRFYAPDGVIERFNDSTKSVTDWSRQFDAATLPRINRMADETTRTARQFMRTVGSLNDNPQSLIYGPSQHPPGPGEPGFSAAPNKTSP